MGCFRANLLYRARDPLHPYLLRVAPLCNFGGKRNDSKARGFHER